MSISSSKKKPSTCTIRDCREPNKLSNCDFCHKKYCSQHKTARPPWPPHKIPRTDFEKYAASESRIPGGHICVSYHDYLKILNKINETERDVDLPWTKKSENESEKTAWLPKAKNNEREEKSVIDKILKEDKSEDNKIVFSKIKDDNKIGKRKNHKLKISLKQIISTSIIVLFLSFIFIIYATFTETEYIKTINQTKTELVTKNITIGNTISYKRYYENMDELSDEYVEIKGYLQKEIQYTDETHIAGKYYYYIIDDFERKIELVGIKTEHKTYFTNINSNQLYKILGTANVRNQSLTINLDSITLTQREPIRIVTETVPEKYTISNQTVLKEPKYPLIRKTVLSLIGKEV